WWDFWKVSRGHKGQVGQVLLTLRFPNCVNCFWHDSNLQVNGLACSCTILCARTLPRCANFLPQNSQAYGFSPVWRRSCVLRLPSCEKRWPHPGSLQVCLEGDWSACGEED